MERHNHIHTGEAHLWWHAEDATGAPPIVLDDDERSRASRFRFERDARRFRVRRAFVRTVLAGYLGIPPQGVRLLASRRGKPRLHPACQLSFNVSRADGLTVVAVAAGEPIGIDIERRRPVPDVEELAAHYFTPREAAQVRAAPESGRGDTFLDLWTRKESLLKAIGTGLATELDRYDVSSRDPGDRVRPRGPRGELPFVIARLGPHEDLVGSVTLKGAAVTITSMGGGPPGWRVGAAGAAR